MITFVLLLSKPPRAASAPFSLSGRQRRRETKRAAFLGEARGAEAAARERAAAREAAAAQRAEDAERRQAERIDKAQEAEARAAAAGEAAGRAFRGYMRSVTPSPSETGCSYTPSS